MSEANVDITRRHYEREAEAFRGGDVCASSRSSETIRESSRRARRKASLSNEAGAATTA
jgi:hypothetical protein